MEWLFSQLVYIILYITGIPWSSRLRKPHQPQQAPVEVLTGVQFFCGLITTFCEIVRFLAVSQSQHKLICRCTEVKAVRCMGCLWELHSRPCHPARQCNRNLASPRLICKRTVLPSRAAREPIRHDLRHLFSISNKVCEDFSLDWFLPRMIEELECGPLWRPCPVPW